MSSVSTAVSVVMPVFNAGAFVQRAARSALAQPEVAELMLIEDGSHDDSWARCLELASVDPRVRTLRSPNGRNRGAGAARNMGWRAARADLVAFLDADDYYLPGRFAVALERLANPEITGVYEAVGIEYESEQARQQFLDMKGRHLTPQGLTTLVPGLKPEELCRKLLWGSAGFCHLDGLTVRRRLLERCNGFHEPLRLHQDSQLLVRLAWHGRLVAGTIDRPVAIRFVHANNRITRATRAVSLPYRRRLNRSLFDWILRESLPRELLRLVFLRIYFDAYHEDFARLPADKASRWRRRWRALCLLAREFLAGPARVIRVVRRLWPAENAAPSAPRG